MNLNDFAKEVHENAVAHGWWDEERSDGTLRSLMHAELSEALEEYRAKRAMVWHACKLGGMCETQEVHQGDIGCDHCSPQMRKPEGVAVELIDFVIRALDWMAKRELSFHESLNTVQAFIENGTKKMDSGWWEDIRAFSLPDVVDVLHMLVCGFASHDVGFEETEAIGIVFVWLNLQGIDPEALMLEKHEYNKMRPYKHGGKVC